MLPTASPAQAVAISPEALEIANSYLTTQNMQKTAYDLCIPVDQVTDTLDRREVRSYIDQIFLDTGFNSRFKMREVMDVIIQKKLQELDEAEVGSGKDIADLLALSHKMTMEIMDKQIQLEKVRSNNTSVKTQVNMQINDASGHDGTKYGSLISKLLGASS
jgi:hypothetical protein